MKQRARKLVLHQRAAEIGVQVVNRPNAVERLQTLVSQLVGQRVRLQRVVGAGGKQGGAEPVGAVLWNQDDLRGAALVFRRAAGAGVDDDFLRRQRIDVDAPAGGCGYPVVG